VRGEKESKKKDGRKYFEGENTSRGRKFFEGGKKSRGRKYCEKVASIRSIAPYDNLRTRVYLQH
jgi:hypothetical protein